MGLFAFLMLLLIVVVSAALQEPGFFSWSYWQHGGVNTSRSEVVRNLGLLAAGLIGLGVGTWRAFTAYRQTQASQSQADAALEQAETANKLAQLGEEGHFTERFSQAVEHLGSGQLTMRLGGIYALWRLAQNSGNRDLTSVLDILCAFVRDPPRISEGAAASTPTEAPGGDRSKFARLRADVQAVLSLISDQNAHWRTTLELEYSLDLEGADLKYAELSRANLALANLAGADLSHARMWGCNLARANLWGADLVQAQLSSASFKGATVCFTKLTGAGLAGAKLEGLRIWKSSFHAADLFEADLTSSMVRDTSLKNANLIQANLTDADLRGAADLTQKQVSSAACDPANPPGLPEELSPPEQRPMVDLFG